MDHEQLAKLTCTPSFQLAEGVRSLIWQHGAWQAAALILHKCSLQLPGSAFIPSSLAAMLAKLETSVPTREPPVWYP
jgi:hypothetical protein